MIQVEAIHPISRRKHALRMGLGRKTINADEYLALIFIEDYGESMRVLSEKLGVQISHTLLHPYHQWVLIQIRLAAKERGWGKRPHDRKLLKNWVKNNQQNLSFLAYQYKKEKNYEARNSDKELPTQRQLAPVPNLGTTGI